MVTPATRSRGSALIISLIVLVLISLIVASAFSLTSSNLRSVANVQYRSEAIAVANRALEATISGSFLGALGTSASSSVDLDKDGTAEYTVVVGIPTCPLRVRRVALDAPTGYEVAGMSGTAGTYVADYELTATVNDTSTGASATVRQGVRVPLTETDYQSYVNVTACSLTLMT